MPGISFPCPSCGAMLRGPANLPPGTGVRCNKCNTSFRYGVKAASPAPPRTTPRRETRGAEAAPETRLRRSADEAPPRRRPRDEDADEAPAARRPSRRKKASKSERPNRGLMIGLAVGGGAGLLVIVLLVVVLGVWLASLDKPANPVIVRSPAPSGPSAPSAPVAWQPPPPADAPVVDQPVVDQPVVDQPVVGPPPVADPAPAPAPAPAASGNGSLADDVLDKVKKATVYIRVTGAEGRVSGSGFFEASSGQVLTNAHVIGMLHGEEPPQKIEVVLRSGEKDEKTLPGRILAVDRVSDLAVLSVDVRTAGLSAPPAALNVASAAGLHETQQVFVFGFPFGEGLGKNITVSTSSVSSLRKDKDGVLAQVQVNGGMNPGNSGGPVVDAAGNVVGVAVAGIKGTQINFAIPGDSVQTVFRGRCSGISVGEAFRGKDGRITVPVDVTAIDPMHHIRKFAIDWWTGDPGDSVPPSATQPTAPPRQTTALEYRPEAMAGHVELILPALPPAGKVLWVQPNFVDGAGRSVWASGLPVPVASPVDVKPAVLVLRPQAGKSRVSLKSTATMQLRTADGEQHSLHSNIETGLVEDTQAIDPRGNVSVFDSVERFAVGISIDGKAPPMSPRMKRIVQDVGKLGLSLTLDPQGDVMQKQTDLRLVPEGSREALDGMGDQILQSLDVASPPVPGGKVQPGQTWRAARDVPIDTLDSYMTAAADMTYTYRGVRSIDGRDYGIVNFKGMVRPMKGRASGLAGEVHGTAAIDLAAGRVHQVHALVDVTLDVQFRDESLRTNGKLEVNLSRTGP